MKVIISFLTFISIYLLPASVLACSCGKQDAGKKIENSDIIFLGVFEDIDKKNNVEYAFFNVINSWKGESEDRIKIKQGGGIDCIWYFNQLYIGSYYLIFADESSSYIEDNEKIYLVSACGGAERIDTENNTIEYLNGKFN